MSVVNNLAELDTMLVRSEIGYRVHSVDVVPCFFARFPSYILHVMKKCFEDWKSFIHSFDGFGIAFIIFY